LKATPPARVAGRGETEPLSGEEQKQELTMILKRFQPWHAEVWVAAACALALATSVHAADGMAAGSGAGRSGPQPAQAGANVQMNAPQSAAPNGRLGRPAEAIVADPTGKLLVAAWETMQGTCGPPFGGACTPPKTPGVSVVGYSTDGGRTWIDAGAPYLGGNAMTSGHPWLDRGGADGQTFFLTSRAADVRPAPKDSTPGGSGQLGVLLFRGRFKDGVLTWSDEHLFTPRKSSDILRSPSLLAAKDGSGRVYVALSTLRGVCGRTGWAGGQVEAYRSADGGKTWEGPVIVAPDDFVETADLKDPHCGDHGTIQISTSMALGSRGEVYLTWQAGPQLLSIEPLALSHTTIIRFSRSLDGGRTFSAPRELASVHSMRENPPAGYSKTTVNDFPRLAFAAAGSHRGRLYVTYTSAVTEATGPDSQQVPVSSQVYLIHSDDQGTTWSAPVPLGPAVPPAGVKRFWPVVAVRDSGEVDVVYMESQEKQATPDPDDVECDIRNVVGGHRKGKLSSLSDIYWVQSRDGGASFGPPVRVTSETTNWCKVAYDLQGTQFANFGDYLGIFTTGSRTFVVWPDGRHGVPDAYFAELPAASVSQTTAGKGR
jgi:hypothetical protein